MNCGPSDQLPGFLDLNWDQSAPPNSFPPTSNVGEIFAQPLYMSALLNSPPKLQLSMMDHRRPQQDSGNSTLSGGDLSTFSTDPGFIERVAKFSNFVGCRKYGRLTGQFELPDAGKLSSCNSLRMNGLQLRCVEMGNAGDDSSAANPLLAGESNARKRKAVPKGKGKDTPKAVVEAEDANAKRGRTLDDSKSQMYEIESKVEQKCGVCSSTVDDVKEMGKENNLKPPEPPKQDYIHVRARRGQATDSHSLAERVRREKISERMKLLQGLVPGCNKVNGKALMLDEIINYVQSLQQQVEFLSLKLESVNPRTDFNVENLIQKDMHQGSGPLLNSVSAAAFSYAHQSPQCVMSNGLETQCSMNPLEFVVHRTVSMQLQPETGLVDPNSSQLGTFWEDDLHNVVQMGFVQSQEMTFNGFHGI